MALQSLYLGNVVFLSERGNLSAERNSENGVVSAFMGDLEMMRVSPAGSVLVLRSCFIKGGPIKKMRIVIDDSDNGSGKMFTLEKNIPVSFYLKGEGQDEPYAEWQITVLNMPT